MDDGTEGEMVLSGNYWKGMSSTSQAKLDSPSNPSPEATTSDGDKKDADNKEALIVVDKSNRARGSVAFSVLDGVVWRWENLETGNVKIEAQADEIQASGFIQRFRVVEEEAKKGSP